MSSRYLAELRSELKKHADPRKAPLMQAYMKSSMPYHGVSAKPVREICRRVLANASFRNQKAWEKEVLAIWKEAKFREERYGALYLSDHRCAKAYQNPQAMKLYENLIVTGAWWDFVDELASNRVGPILEAYPTVMKPLMRKWSRSDNMWKRRTSILSQLGFKDETDLKLLYDCIEPSIESKEFFLRKAIGWALRDLAWTNPKEVRRYVKKQGERLSGLSRREALKNIGP